jgi:outer membrane protein assembly factor BamB
MVDIDGIFQVQNNVIYVTAYQGRIAAVSAVDGRAIWTRELSSYTGVSLDKQHVYTTDSDGYVWSLDIETGATLWRQDKLVGRDLTAPVLMGDTVVVSDRGGFVHWLSKEDGGFVARANVGEVYKRVMVDWGDEDMDERDIAVTTPPVVEKNALYVRDNAGALSAFKISPKKK